MLVLAQGHKSMLLTKFVALKETSLTNCVPHNVTFQGPSCLHLIHIFVNTLIHFPHTGDFPLTVHPLNA